jgi:plasmid stabilization system protein ParE
VKIGFTSRALRQMRVAGAWWRRNRHKSPNALEDEIDRALLLLSSHPLSGPPVRARPGVRKIELLVTGYHLYYRVVNGAIQILGLWHARRGSKPRL